MSKEKTVDSEPVRIGLSQVYVFNRTTTNEDGESWSRPVFALWGDAGSTEIDPWEAPNSEDVKEMIKLFSIYL